MAQVHKISIDVSDLEKSLSTLRSMESSMRDISAEMSQISEQLKGNQQQALSLSEEVKESLKEAFENLQITPIINALKGVGSTLVKSVGGALSVVRDKLRNNLIKPLGNALGAARSLGLALMGAASAAMGMSVGAIERDREAKDAGIDSNRLNAWNFALKQKGMEGSLDLANLNTMLQSPEKAGTFATLGLNQQELKKMGTDKAMLSILSSVAKQFGDMENIPEEFRDAINSLTGLDINTKRDFFSEKGLRDFQKFLDKGDKIWKSLPAHKLQAANEALNEFLETIKVLGLNIAAAFMPVITDVTNKLSEVVQKFIAWLSSDEGQSLINALQSFLSTIVGAFGSLAKALSPLLTTGFKSLSLIILKIKQAFGGGLNAKDLATMKEMEESLAQDRIKKLEEKRTAASLHWEREAERVRVERQEVYHHNEVVIKDTKGNTLGEFSTKQIAGRAK